MTFNILLVIYSYEHCSGFRSPHENCQNCQNQMPKIDYIKMESLGRTRTEIASDICCTDCGSVLMSTIVLINRTKYAIKMPITINISLWGERKTIMIGHWRRFTHKMLFGSSNKKNAKLSIQVLRKTEIIFVYNTVEGEDDKIKAWAAAASSCGGSAALEKNVIDSSTEKICNKIKARRVFSGFAVVYRFLSRQTLVREQSRTSPIQLEPHSAQLSCLLR